MDEPASSDAENEASHETEIGLLAEAFRESLTRHGKCTSYRGLPWGASREAEIASGRRDLLCEARGGAKSLVGSDVAGEEPTA